jgi:poly-gamma-glutamate synthesis protein (capsule biosynthesis protein)
VAFTKGLSGMGLPAGSESCVNLLYEDYNSAYQKVDTDGITKVLRSAQAEKPDVTIALLHWGSEYKGIISANQSAIRDLLLAGGVDAIIGTHSHYVQDVEYNKNTGTVVAYSLGDLLGTADKADTNYSIVLQLQITKDHATGKTAITNCSYTPVYTLTEGRDGEALRLVRLESAMTMFENNHVDRISAKAYENMKTALAKIRSKPGM